MASVSGGPGDESFVITSADAGETIDGGAGDDSLLLDWSDKTFFVRGEFRTYLGEDLALFDDPLSGVYVEARDIEHITALFGSGDDQFSLRDGLKATLDGGAGMDFFVGDFRASAASIGFVLDQSAGATTTVAGQGSAIRNFERVQVYTGSGNDTLVGGALSDTLSAGAGDNVLDGGAGNDHLLTGAGVNVIEGGAGHDDWTGDYSTRTLGLTIDQREDGALSFSDGGSVHGAEEIDLKLGSGADIIHLDRGLLIDINAGAGLDTATVNWSGMTDDVTGNLIGSPGASQFNNAVTGEHINLSGLERLSVRFGSGSDTFHLTGPLTATVDGGAGVDSFYGNFSTSRTTLSVDAARARGGELTVVGQGSVAQNFEQFEIYTGSGADRLVGGALADTLSSGSGHDSMLGGGGDDSLMAGAGDDTVGGGPGDDRLYGGPGIDTVSYAGATNGVRVTLGRPDQFQDTGGAGSDYLSGFENVLGSASGDELKGSGQANTLLGGAGFDTLSGGGGNDLVRGQDGDDQLLGEAGDDRLIGDDGADTLTGGFGADQLRGGAGGDHFVFTSVSDSTVTAAGRDRLPDFALLEGDRIDLSAIDAVAGGADDAFSFVERFSGERGQVIALDRGDYSLVLADLDGDRLADFGLYVSGAETLAAEAFVL